MPTTIEGIRFFTIIEVAQALGVTHQTVRAYIRQGRLRGQKIGRPYFITENSLREFLETPEKVALKVGRPKK